MLTTGRQSWNDRGPPVDFRGKGHRKKFTWQAHLGNARVGTSVNDHIQPAEVYPEDRLDLPKAHREDCLK